MKKILISGVIFILSLQFSFAQVQIDKPIQMTGSSSANRQIKNVGEPTHPTDATNAETVQSGKLNYADAAGSVNAFAVTLSPAASAYAPGMIVNFKANNAITGVTTINVNGLGTKVIKKQVTTDLAANDILGGQLVSLIYDGSNFQMLSTGSSQSNAVNSGPTFLSNFINLNAQTSSATNVWIAQDLSQVVPINAKAVILHIYFYGYLQLRANSSSGIMYFPWQSNNAALQITMPLSNNKTFEVNTNSNSGINLTVIGYY